MLIQHSTNRTNSCGAELEVVTQKGKVEVERLETSLDNGYIDELVT